MQTVQKTQQSAQGQQMAAKQVAPIKDRAQAKGSESDDSELAKLKEKYQTKEKLEASLDRCIARETDALARLSGLRNRITRRQELMKSWNVDTSKSK